MAWLSSEGDAFRDTAKRLRVKYMMSPSSVKDLFEDLLDRWLTRRIEYVVIIVAIQKCRFQACGQDSSRLAQWSPWKIRRTSSLECFKLPVVGMSDPLFRQRLLLPFDGQARRVALCGGSTTWLELSSRRSWGLAVVRRILTLAEARQRLRNLAAASRAVLSGQTTSDVGYLHCATEPHGNDDCESITKAGPSVVCIRVFYICPRRPTP